MTVQDDLNDLIDTIESNLTTMGVTNAEFDSTTGLKGLLTKILDIEGSVGGLTISTSLTCTTSTNTTYPNAPFTVNGKLNASYDDTTQINEDFLGFIQHATIKIYNGDTLLGTTTTDNNGEYSYTYTPTTTGNLSIKAIYDGNNYYDSCYSSNVSVSVNDLFELNTNKVILSEYHGDTCTLTANYNGITGQSIYLYDDSGQVGLMTDNLDGTYSYTYTSQGIGDINFYAKLENTESNLILVEDCFYYDDASIDHSSDYTHYVIESYMSYGSFTYDTDKYVTSGGSNTQIFVLDDLGEIIDAEITLTCRPTGNDFNYTLGFGFQKQQYQCNGIMVRQNQSLRRVKYPWSDDYQTWDNVPITFDSDGYGTVTIIKEGSNITYPNGTVRTIEWSSCKLGVMTGTTTLSWKELKIKNIE